MKWDMNGGAREKSVCQVEQLVDHVRNQFMNTEPLPDVDHVRNLFMNTERLPDVDHVRNLFMNTERLPDVDHVRNLFMNTARLQDVDHVRNQFMNTARLQATTGCPPSCCHQQPVPAATDEAGQQPVPAATDEAGQQPVLVHTLALSPAVDVSSSPRSQATISQRSGLVATHLSVFTKVRHKWIPGHTRGMRLVASQIQPTQPASSHVTSASGAPDLVKFCGGRVLGQGRALSQSKSIHARSLCLVEQSRDCARPAASGVYLARTEAENEKLNKLALDNQTLNHTALDNPPLNIKLVTVTKTSCPDRVARPAGRGSSKHYQLHCRQKRTTRWRRSRTARNGNIRRRHKLPKRAINGRCKVRAMSPRVSCGTRRVGWVGRKEIHVMPQVVRGPRRAGGSSGTSLVGSSEMAAHCFLNVNSNAGISESGSDNVKGETKQPSCTSLLSIVSSDQYYSIHTDTPDGRINDSDLEVSPSFSSIEDVAGKGNLSDLELTASRSNEQTRSAFTEPEGGKQAIALASSETIKAKQSKKSADTSHGDDNTDIKFVRRPSSSLALPSAPQDEANRGKTKTTETLYIKFESSMSKKVTTTTVLKDARKSASTKPRLEFNRRALPLENCQREASKALDNRNVPENPRFTKIVRYNEGRYESPENTLKGNVKLSTPETLPQTRTHHSPDIWCVADARCQTVKSMPIYGPRFDSISPSKHTVSLPERLAFRQPSYKPHSSPCSHEHVQDVMDSDYASEKDSSAATIVDVQKPLLMKEATPLAEQSFRTDTINKMDKPKTDFHKRENIYPERRQQLKQASQKEYQVNPTDRKQEQHVRPDQVSASRAQSPVGEHSFKLDTLFRKKNQANCKDISPVKKSPAEAVRAETVRPETVKSETGRVETIRAETVRAETVKAELKKRPSSRTRSRTTDDSSGKQETPKGKRSLQPAQATKKKSPARVKTPPRSPAVKKKKQSVKKSAEIKSKNNTDSLKSRKQKVAEKEMDTRKKKKNHKRKWCEKSASATVESHSSMKKRRPIKRSRSQEASKTTQTMSCNSASAPQFLEVTLLSEELSPLTHWRAKKSLSATDEDKHTADSVMRSLDKSGIMRSGELRLKGRGTSSVENVSICTVGDTRVGSAESLSPFTGTVYTTLTKVVHMTSCPKLKRSEKELQQAELGWNSSMLTAEEKAAIERSKQQQKRAKVKARYFLAKSKLKKNLLDAAATKLKPRRWHADGDNIREVSNKEDMAQQDKMKATQGKSVQFSDSTEDHKACKDDTETDKSSQQVSDNIFGQQSANKTLAEVLKALNRLEADASASGKLSAPRKDESRAQTTPPRKKRPLWLKKHPKETSNECAKAGTASKPGSALLPINPQNPAEMSQKPPPPRLVHLPLKHRLQSSTLANPGRDDETAVAYNSWINSALLSTPMTKATRKLVAKTGSPVDIKEIIEGSSVDAADYYRAIWSMQELGVRVAKSVPSLGEQRPACTDLFRSRRIKPLTKARVSRHRKGKDGSFQENCSVRSVSSAESAGPKFQPSDTEEQLSPASSTDVDMAAMVLKLKTGPGRLAGTSQVRKEKRHAKKDFPDSPGKWREVNAQDVCSVPDLTHVQYYGDMAEFTALNMGLTWIVQSVFNRLPFLNGKQPAAAANASGDTSANEQ